MAELTWGSGVRVKADAPVEYRPGAVASVCGFREDPKDSTAQLLTIEFADGSDVEVSECLVELLA